jgi:hypothetical protein
MFCNGRSDRHAQRLRDVLEALLADNASRKGRDVVQAIEQ